MRYFQSSFCFILRCNTLAGSNTHRVFALCQEVAELLTSKAASSKKNPWKNSEIYFGVDF